MTAQEMFEYMEYKREENEFCISYEGGRGRYFVFHKRDKVITMGKYHVVFEELNAINKQCKELGWFDD